jgi:hypothetical protein
MRCGFVRRRILEPGTNPTEGNEENKDLNKSDVTL